MRPDEIIFEVTEAPEGGHDTIAQGAAIFTARELARRPCGRCSQRLRTRIGHAAYRALSG